MRWGLTALLLLVACGDPPPETDAGGPTDAGPPATDAGPDLRLDREGADLVDPFIGTGSIAFFSANCFPGAVRPFGMVSASPDTQTETGAAWFDHAAGYHYDDDLLQGFSHHRLQGTSTPDLGTVLLTPAAGDAASLVDPAARLHRFAKDDEEASPGYYALRLDELGVRAELTATTRAAHHRYTFDAAVEQPRVVLDLGHSLLRSEITAASVDVTGVAQIEGTATVSGRASSNAPGGMTSHFYLEVRPTPTAIGTFGGGAYDEATSARTGTDVGAVLSFEPGVGEVEIRIGLSWVDIDGARGNLAAEIPEWTFDTVRSDARAAWESQLGRVRFEGGSGAEREIMATALYHSFIVPNVYQDVDQRYRGLDGEVHTADFAYHSNFSMWDTYRTVHPLLALADPDRQLDMARSLMRMGEDGGYVPRWPMGHAYTNITVGSPADIVLAESVLMGLALDGDAVLDMLLRHADAPVPGAHPFGGRDAMASYLSLGWVPADETGRSVSRTLENVVSDGAIARLARSVGRDAVADDFEARARNYENLWDPELRVFRGRNADGSWAEPFDPIAYQSLGLFYGTNALQYGWHTPHDPLGLVGLFGSPEAMEADLLAFFEQGREELENPGPLWGVAPNFYYNHANEPDVHAAYLFHAVGRPDLAQEWADWIARSWYSDDPAGIRGNEDAGTLSAWYVLTQLGLFPMHGTGRWWIGRPAFDRAELAVANGTLVIERVGSGVYVESVSIDGAPLTQPWVEHATLAAGPTIVFTMSETPGAFGRELGDL